MQKFTNANAWEELTGAMYCYVAENYLTLQHHVREQQSNFKNKVILKSFGEK